jgi:hypothetical protein
MELFISAVALWVAFCGLVTVWSPPTAKKMAFWPLRLLRSAVGQLLIEIGRAIGGKKK